VTRVPEVSYFPLYIDDRGSVYCPIDNIGSHELQFDIRRTYVIQNWNSGLIRAWHGHKSGWTGIHVIKGTAKLAAMKMDNPSKVVVATLSDRKPGIFWIPPGWYNGSVTLEEDTRMLVYSTHSFEEVKKDDHRLKLSEADIDNIFGVDNK